MLGQSSDLPQEKNSCITWRTSGGRRRVSVTRFDMTVFSSTPRFFQGSAHSLTRGLVLLLVLSHAALMLSSMVSSSHDPLRAITHTHALAIADANQAGHSHGDQNDEHGLHQHGHNPADHSHDKPNLPPVQTVVTLQLSNYWHADEHCLVYPPPCSSLERPPKHFSMIRRDESCI